MQTLTYEQVQKSLGETLNTVMQEPVTITGEGRPPIMMVPVTEQILRAVRSFYFDQLQEEVRQSQREPITEEELNKLVDDLR
jgi:PHD/YefM family antitoxin component YafN of YafNO toxin-antitoxin module